MNPRIITLVALLLECTTDMPGCLSYVVAHDPADADRIWITEVWESQTHHADSLKLPEVRAVIDRAMPLIASFGDPTFTEPVGGFGLAKG